MNKKLFFFLIPLIAGCHHAAHQSDSIVSIQMVDRNGFSETISNKERLGVYQNVNFLTSQPYEKVLRVYGKDKEGKNHSKLTSYHSNGGIWQFLEALDGRAHGRYLEWHENGKPYIEAFVIEGLADLGEAAKQSWLFDQECTVWNEEGTLQAKFFYEKGYLHGEAEYYYPSGALQKVIPYTHGVVDGTLQIYSENGNTLEEMHFEKGDREGAAIGSWDTGSSKYQEQYRNNLLMNATYFDPKGSVLAEVENGHGMKASFEDHRLSALIEINNGIPDGKVELFDSQGNLTSSYCIKEGKKHGEEWEYYLPNAPKLMVTWDDDSIQGMVKTWYENGVLESQREMVNNKKHGLSFAYFKNGDLMLMEEYENDRLIKGSYYKKGEANPVSTIEKGDGEATLYSGDGQFLRKVTYDHGKPVVQ